MPSTVSAQTPLVMYVFPVCTCYCMYICFGEQLIVFANAVEMSAIELEGLIAYRIDVKQLFYRDNVTWRPIRVSRLMISV